MDTPHRNNRRLDAGFTLIEVLLVVTIIGIVASIAIPSLSRARGAATEAATIGALRAIHASQVAYSTSCANGSYAPSIPWLAKVVTKGQFAFVGPQFTADTTDRQRYRIRFTAGAVDKNAKVTCNGLGAGLAVGTFFVGADLLVAKDGMVSRYFGVNQTGTIYQSTKRITPFYTGVPPAPALPIR